MLGRKALEGKWRGTALVVHREDIGEFGWLWSEGVLFLEIPRKDDGPSQHLL